MIEGLEVLVARLKAAEQAAASEQIRILIDIHKLVADVISEVLTIAADGVEDAEDEEGTTE